MCGPAGSGKSTYARRLEDEGMVRLSFDVEMWRRGITAVPLPAGLRAEIEADLRTRLLVLVAEGADVVLDFSFWWRRMRDDYRRLLEPTGVVPETIYLATDRDTVLARVAARRGSHSDDFVIGEDLAAQYFDHFEPPTQDEGPLTVIRWSVGARLASMNATLEVKAAAEDRARALAAGDAARLRELLHDDFAWTSHVGATFDRSEYIQRNTTGSSAWRSQRLTDVEVAVVGDAAVLRCEVIDEVTGADNVVETFRMPMTQVWVRVADGWQCLAGHAGPRLP
jgi:predicted kinase/ketosteroid isomerase-like protein